MRKSNCSRYLVETRDVFRFQKKLSLNKQRAEKNMIIHTLHTTYLFEGVVAEINDVQSRDYSPSVLVKLDRTSYARDINL